MIELKKVSKMYLPDVVALKDVSFKVEDREFVLIAGKSGAGKTTVLKLILAREYPSSGRILWHDKDIAQIKKRELPFYRRKIGIVFQDYKLLPSKTVWENIAFVLEALDADDEEIERNIPKVLEIVGLKNKADKFPNQLSAGESQRAAIARALIHRPEMILADEPTGNLDPYNTSEIIKLFLKINEFGTTIILATHNKELIKKLKKRTILFKDAKLIRDDEKGGVIL